MLASTSRYRAELMDTLGLDYVAAAPDVDERALDHRFAGLGAELGLGAGGTIPAAAELLRVLACAPQAVVSDVNLPGVSGAEALKG